MNLAARRVTWGVGDAVLVDDVSIDVAGARTIGLLGPNGSGKSSLLRLLAGVRRPTGGAVVLDERPITAWTRRDVARRLAVLEQDAHTETDLTVAEVARLGRTPHRPVVAGSTAEDERIVDEVLDRVDLAKLRDRRWSTLSGGERQRVQLARALVQQPRVLLLDEPTNHLDVRHQVALLEMVRCSGATVIAALHDLTLAAAYCDRIVLLSNGRVVAAGTPSDVLTADRIEQVYGVRTVVERGTTTGRVVVTFMAPEPDGE